MSRLSGLPRLAAAALLLATTAACSAVSATGPDVTQPPPAGDESGQPPAQQTTTPTPTPTPSPAADATLAVLVNKTNALEPVSYAPDDLVAVDVPTVLESEEVNQLRRPAAEALRELFDAAEREGYKLYARSGYRSYATQQSLYNGYVDKHGQAEADRFSAKPGHSEHQTGLAMDITCESVSLQLTEAFGETDEGVWVSEHAHEFGFIIRYPKGKESITGYTYEPWHLRYLGPELATQVRASGLTYDEWTTDNGGEPS